jgi:predicted DCC family thiol-disulfide oxidoreductase YuxK
VSPTRPRARPMRPERPTLIYDGECGFCRDAVAVVARWDHTNAVALVPLQDEARVAGIGIPPDRLAAAMHLALPDGRIFAGADAVVALLRVLPGRRWLAWPFSLPGVLPLARRVYREVARRRHCLVRGVATR